MDTQFCLKLKVFPLQQSIKELLSLQDVITSCNDNSSLIDCCKGNTFNFKQNWVSISAIYYV